MQLLLNKIKNYTEVSNSASSIRPNLQEFKSPPKNNSVLCKQRQITKNYTLNNLPINKRC